MPAISKVVIARMALSRTGALSESSNIESFNEESVEARKASLWYDISRQSVLSKSDWGFARKSVDLALHPTAPISDWGFRYIVPSDALVLRGIVSPFGKTAETPESTLETVGGQKTLMTDIENAKLLYTADVQDTGLFTPSFTDVLISTLAANVVVDVIGIKVGANLAIALRQDAERLLQDAEQIDANQERSPDSPDPEWITER